MNKLLFCFSVYLIFSVNLQANNSEIKEKIVSSLISEGFENIRIDISDSRLILAYENRLYRFEIDGLQKVFEILNSSIKNDIIEQIIIVIQNKKIPLIKINLLNKNLVSYMNKEIDSEEFAENLKISTDVYDVWSEINKKENVNSSNMKFDLILNPTYKFEFGLFSDPVKYQLNIAPSIEFSLWKGMTALYELTIPIHNDLLPREDSIRTSIFVVNQTIRFSNSFFISASLGYFTQNRYGIDLDLKNYFLNGDLSLGFNLGYTGYASFSGTKLFYSDPYLWTASGNIEYRIQEYDLTLGLMAGKFLLGDNTIRVDINRDFGEVQIGFFALKSSNGVSNGGINIIIPFFPSKHFKPNIIRLRTAEYLPYSYLVKTNTDDLIGLRYNTGFRIIDFNEKLNPGFVKNYFQNRIQNN